MSNKLSMCIPRGNSAFQPMKYGSKELDRANGWDSLDYGARWLMPAVAQWPTPDPLASTTPEIYPKLQSPIRISNDENNLSVNHYTI